MKNLDQCNDWEDHGLWGSSQLIINNIGAGLDPDSWFWENSENGGSMIDGELLKKMDFINSISDSQLRDRLSAHLLDLLSIDRGERKIIETPQNKTFDDLVTDVAEKNPDLTVPESLPGLRGFYKALFQRIKNYAEAPEERLMAVPHENVPDDLRGKIRADVEDLLRNGKF